MYGKDLSHKDLVQRAARWLQGTQKCPVVLYEVQAGDEIPDAIGWKRAAHDSILVECKRTYADFKRDKDKPFRVEGKGVGNYRYFLVTPGLVKLEEVPPKWGLLECGSYNIKKLKEAERVVLDNRALRLEMRMMYQSLHRQADNIQKINSFLSDVWPLRGHINGAFPISDEPLVTEQTETAFPERLIGLPFQVAVSEAAHEGFSLILENNEEKMVLSRVQVLVVDDKVAAARIG